MPDDQLQFVPWDVPDHMRSHVHRVTGFRDLQSGLVRRELLIVGCPLMFAFGAPYRLSERSDPARPTGVYRSFFAGMFDTYTMSENLGVSEGVHVDLTPLGACQLLGLPMHELTNRIIPIDGILHGDDRMLEERLGNCQTWEQRFHLIERFLVARFSGPVRFSPEVDWAWAQLMKSRGTTPVSLLTDELRWSRKRLRNAFLHEIGFPPKLVGRMLRYRHAVDLVRAEPHRSWAEIAGVTGYHDQAHMHRDVRAFAGLTPGDLRRELTAGTFFQDAPKNDL